jgi:alkaline phosphatase
MTLKIKPITIGVSGALSFALCLPLMAATPDKFPAPASDPNFWFAKGSKEVVDAKKIKPNNRVAKNVILFIGDGMGVSTVTAARILEGQQPGIIDKSKPALGTSGEENLLSFEEFPYLSHSRTYSVNQQTSDSAPTMTAMVTGVKNNEGELSVSQAFPKGVSAADCNKDAKPFALETILEIAEDKGKSTGIISTARITHATPAANYAHSSNRDWESDADQPAVGCAIKDIARQLVEFGHGDGIDFVMGGGRDRFLTNTTQDPEYSTKTGKRKDGRDLTVAWKNTYPTGAYVFDRKGFDAIDPGTAKHVLGLFEPSHMQYEADRLSANNEPSLSEMTDKAIRTLSNNKKGFYLQVEAGRIDHAHHAGNAYRALTDTIALSDAVQRAVDTLRETKQLENTLIIISADHSHVFTIGGYPERGNNILGKVYADGVAQLGSDKKPYTTLAYANGPGFAVNAPADGAPYAPNAGRTANLATVDTTNIDFHQEALVPLGSETHAGEDVSIYAVGPSAHLFHGTQEQNTIFHVMKSAFRFK